MLVAIAKHAFQTSNCVNPRLLRRARRASQDTNLTFGITQFIPLGTASSRYTTPPNDSLNHLVHL